MLSKGLASTTRLVLLGTAAMVLGAAPAWAAQNDPAPSESADSENTGDGEILVTARRVSENVQKVPVAINVFTQERLQETQINNVTRLQTITPGVQMCCSAWNNSLTTNVRGIQSSAPTYFADAPATSQGFGNFFDVENVQVLKGPQGTLFGQASAAGAFIYQPKRPKDEFSGYGSATVGSYNRRTIEGAVNIPVVADRVLVRLAGITSARDGYITDVSTGLDYANEQYRILRGSLILRITDNLKNYTMYQSQRGSQHGQTFGNYVLEDLNFNAVPSQFTLANAIIAVNGGSAAAFKALQDQVLSTQLKLGPYKVQGLSVGCASGARQGPTFISDINYNRVACPHDRYNYNNLVNQTKLTLGNWTVKGIYGREWGDQWIGPTDLDMSPLILTNFNSWRSQPTKIATTSSLEGQVFGKVGALDLTVGVFHLFRNNDPGVTYSTSLATDSATRTVSTTKTNAIYGQANIHLTDSLTATLGGRYTWDKLTNISQGLNVNTLAVLTTSGGPGTPAGEAQFENFSYTAGLQYQASEDVMFFVTHARGYTAGGLQNVRGFESFKPAVLDNIEAGVKSSFDLGGMRARVNFSGFYGWFRNVQINTVTIVTSATGTQTFANVTRNAARALIRGLEGDIAIKPTDSLELASTFGYINNTYTEYPSYDPLTLQPIDLSSTAFTRTPKWKVSLSANWKAPIPDNLGTLKLNAFYNYTSQQSYFPAPAKPTNPAIANTGLLCSRERTAANGYGPLSADGGTAWIDCKPARHSIDLGARWSDFLGHDGLSLTLSVTNLTKNIWSDSQATLERQGGFTAFEPAAPRMWTLRAQYDF